MSKPFINLTQAKAMRKEELIDFLHSAIRAASVKLGIHDADWKTSRELIDEIKSLNYEIYQSLDDFIDAYAQCYNDWSPRNIDLRDKARMEILNKLKNLEKN